MFTARLCTCIWVITPSLRAVADPARSLGWGGGGGGTRRRNEEEQWNRRKLWRRSW